jgi:hypothetical protein
MYRKFKEKFTGIDQQSEAIVDYITYARIIKEFNEGLVKGLIEEAREFKLPYRMGKIRIRKFRQKLTLDKNGDIDKRKLSVDWKKTWDLWKSQYPNKIVKDIISIEGKQLVYHLNEHTNGYQCVLYWDRRGCNVVNNRIYSLSFMRPNKRMLAKSLREHHKIDYYE